MSWGETSRNPDGSRTLLTGSPDDIRDDLLRYQEAGLDYLVLSVAAEDTDSTVRAVERLAEVALPVD